MATRLKLHPAPIHSAVEEAPAYVSVLSRRPATAAVNRALLSLPPATRDATLEELTVIGLTEALIAKARELLSPRIYTAFLAWAESAVRFQTLYDLDEEGEEFGDINEAAIKALGRANAANIHDLTFKTYVSVLECADCPPFGPLDGSHGGHHDDTIAHGLLLGICDDLPLASPIPAMLDELSSVAWSLSKPIVVAFSAEVGGEILNCLVRAREIERAAADGCRNGSAEWTAAMAAYQAARSLSDATQDGAPEADARVEAYCKAMDHLIEDVRAPNLEALALKLSLGGERAADFEDVLYNDHMRGVIADVWHLASAGKLQRSPAA